MYLFKETLIDQINAKQQNKLKFLKYVIRYILEYIPLLGVASILLVIPASQSRSAWLAVLISGLVLCELKYSVLKRIFKHWTNLKKSMLVSFIIGVFLIGLFGVYHFKKGSADGRLFIWKVTTQIIKENPIFGVGFDRFKAHYMNAQADYFVKNGEVVEAMVADNAYYAFNEWLQFFCENGLVGLCFIAVVIMLLFKTKIKQENKISGILKICILSIGVFACFSYPMQILPIKLILIVALALLSSLDLNVYKIDIQKNIGTHNIGKTLLVVIAIIGITNGSLYINKLSEGFKTWQFASAPYCDYDISLKEYEAIYEIFKDEGDFLMNYGKTLSLVEEDTKAIAILQQAKQHLNTTIIQTALGDAYKGLKLYKNAEIAYKKAANMIPSRFYPNYLLAKLYDESGNKIKAISMANSVLNKEVKIQSTAIKEMQLEMKSIIAKYDIKTSGFEQKLK